MTAVIIPYPVVRRRDFIARQARVLLATGPAKRENHLQSILAVQREALERKGVDHAIVEAGMAALEAAIRRHLSAAPSRSGGIA